MYVKLHQSKILLAHRRIQLPPCQWQDHRLVAAQVIPFTSHRFVHFTDTLPRFSAQACGSSYVARQLDQLRSLSDCTAAVLSGKKRWASSVGMETSMGSLAKDEIPG